jgi:hypothetical protein
MTDIADEQGVTGEYPGRLPGGAVGKDHDADRLRRVTGCLADLQFHALAVLAEADATTIAVGLDRELGPSGRSRAVTN